MHEENAELNRLDSLPLEERAGELAEAAERLERRLDEISSLTEPRASEDSIPSAG